MATIQKITREELAEVRNTQTSKSLQKNKDNFSIAKNENANTKFISKLKIKQIEDFFTELNIPVNIKKVPNETNPKFIYVQSNFFEGAFNDFDSHFKFINVETDDSNNQFEKEYQMFLQFCNKLNLYPDQALSYLLATKLFGENFPSYANAKRKFDENNIRESVKLMPRNMQRFANIIAEKAENDCNGTYNKLTYGNCDISSYFNS